MAGFSQGGGVGLALSRWIVEGDPGADIWGMDVSRFGSWASPSYTRAKVTENYQKRFSIAYPNEERLRRSSVEGFVSARGSPCGGRVVHF